MTAATSKFEEVLNYISDSKLNFFIQRTPFSAQISLKKSFAVYYEKTENSEKDISESFDNQDRKVEIKSETTGSVKIVDNLKASIEEKNKEIDELRNDKKEIETKLEVSKKEAKKNRQKSQKLQELLKIQKEEIPEESEIEFENRIDPAIETHNKFSKLPESPGKQTVSVIVPKAQPKNEVLDVKHKEVQTETPFYLYDCFYCEQILHSEDQLVNHRQVCHGRPWASCQDCSLKFSSLADLKEHKVKIHDPEKLLNYFKEIFKLPEKNCICRECGEKFELESELELHMLTSRGAQKELLNRRNGH